MNKKIFFLPFTALIILISYFSINSDNKTSKNQNKMENIQIFDLLLDKDNQPQQPLKELLEIFDIKHDNSLKNIVELTQRNWLRTPGKERWEIEEIKTENKQKVFSLLEQLGCIKEIKPLNLINEFSKKSNKNTIIELDFIIAGATIGRILTRTASAIKTYNELSEISKNSEVKFKVRNLIFLGSERQRDEKIEPNEIFTDTKNNFPVKKDWKFDGKFAQTENEMCQFAFNKAEFPKELLDSANVIFICAPMQKNPDGTLRRANTGDTIEELKNELNKRNLKLTRSLLFSNNPYIGYQDSVIRTFLPDDFIVETIGDAASTNEKLAVHLDTIARWLYQEKLRRKI